MTDEFDDPSDDLTPAEIVRITAEIVGAHVSNNSVDLSNLPALIANVHGAFAALADTAGPAQPAATLVPVVSAKASIKPAFIICMECGGKQKILKRHLAVNHHLTPKEYRAKWGLSGDYPMVAPDYSEHRRKMAIELGLGKNAKARALRNATLKAKGKTRAALVG